MRGVVTKDTTFLQYPYKALPMSDAVRYNTPTLRKVVPIQQGFSGASEAPERGAGPRIWGMQQRVPAISPPPPPKAVREKEEAE
jgi:hypothetical protein